MAKPPSLQHGVVFDLGTVGAELHQEETYARVGHTARTLVRTPDLRVVLVALKAGHPIPEHDAEETTSIQALSGHLRLRLPDRTVDLRPGQLLALDRRLRHDVEAVEDSAFLLTLGWRAEG